MTVGSEDDRIGALPMDPFGLLQVPLVGTMVDATLDTLGDAAAAVRRRSRAAARPSCAGRLASRCFRFTVLAGLGHKYPEGAAREFWRFFRTHPLS